MQIQSLEGLASRVSTDPALADAIKDDPAAALSGIAAEASALTKDKWTYRIVVLSLGFAVLIGNDRFYRFVVEGRAKRAGRTGSYWLCCGWCSGWITCSVS